MFTEGILLGIGQAIGLCLVAVIVASVIVLIMCWFVGEDKR
jgi:hypothetical protein